MIVINKQDRIREDTTTTHNAATAQASTPTAASTATATTPFSSVSLASAADALRDFQMQMMRSRRQLNDTKNSFSYKDTAGCVDVSDILARGEQQNNASRESTAQNNKGASMSEKENTGWNKVENTNNKYGTVIPDLSCATLAKEVVAGYGGIKDIPEEFNATAEPKSAESANIPDALQQVAALDLDKPAEKTAENPQNEYIVDLDAFIDDTDVD